MIYNFLIGAIIALLFLFLAIYFFEYSKGFYLYSIFVFTVFIFSLGFGKKTANSFYKIDQTKSYTIEEQYKNDKKIDAFQKTIGGICFFSAIGLFIMSFVNLFVIRNFKEISIIISLGIFIITLLILLLFLAIMLFYSKRII